MPIAFSDAKLRPSAMKLVLEEFKNDNERIAKPSGFHLRFASREREW